MYILEIQKNIEEKRLIFGQKFEKFLQRKLAFLSSFFRNIFASKNSAFFGSCLIIAISILERSSRDLGPDSLGFLVKNFLLNSQPIVDFLVTLLGVLSLYFCTKILKKSEIHKDQTAFNLLVLSFACGFFLRVFTLQFNEFASSSSLLLSFVFPYISYQLVSPEKLKNPQQFSIGLLAGLIICIKPQAIILIGFFEAVNFLKKQNFSFLKNLTNFFVVAVYFSIFPYHKNLITTPDFASLIAIIKTDFFPVFFLSFLCFEEIKKHRFLQQLFLASIAFALIFLSDFSLRYDSRFIFYSISLPLLSSLLFLLIKNRQIDLKRDALWIIFIVAVFQVDADKIQFVVINLTFFWPLFSLFLAVKQHDLKTAKKDFSPLSLWDTETRHESRPALRGSPSLMPMGHTGDFSSMIFFPRDLISWLGFLFFSFAATALFFIDQTRIFSWLISAFLFSMMAIFWQKLKKERQLSTFSTSCIFMVVAYFLSLHLSAIFNLQTIYDAYKLKAPNYLTSQIFKNAKIFVKKDEEILEIFDKIPKTSLQNSISSQLENKKTKLVFVEVKSGLKDQKCEISLLERKLRDPEFKKIFLKNYVFLNRIIERKNGEKEVKFFSEGKELKLPQKPEFIERDVEIYIRK